MYNFVSKIYIFLCTAGILWSYYSEFGYSSDIYLLSYWLLNTTLIVLLVYRNKYTWHLLLYLLLLLIPYNCSQYLSNMGVFWKTSITGLTSRSFAPKMIGHNSAFLIELSLEILLVVWLRLKTTREFYKLLN
ncbi:MAG: hypothetical protein RL757_2839 [Bacteroidota bacterium]|jgi:hypothetical protein